jgi:transposase-like protein
MVVFCESCGVSLPGIDYLIVNGKEVAPPDFVCPHCGKNANLSYQASTSKDEITPQDNEITIIKNGNIQKKKI